MVVEIGIFFFGSELAMRRLGLYNTTYIATMLDQLKRKEWEKKIRRGYL